MNEHENNDLTPDQEPQEEAAPQQPEPSASHGAVRKESPYANSPYVMNHPESASSQQPPCDAPKPKKPRKPGAGKAILAVVLAIALAAGSCGITALLVNNHWEQETARMENSFNQKLDAIQKQMNTPAASGSQGVFRPVASGDQMTPGQLYANNVSSVVSISSTIRSTGFYGTQEGTAGGSGFILTEDGYVITNAHVVEGATAVTVITNDQTEYPATVIGTYSSNDIAVLKIDATGLPAVTLGSSNSLIIGDMVVAIGNPLGTLSYTQTVGYVSGKDRDVTTDGSIISMIQTDAAINSGNSGGPLFNMYGEVVGVTTAKYSGTSGSGATIEGIGFAIPIDDVKDIITDLIDYGYVTGAYLGVTVSDTDAESAAMFGLPVGAYVVTVEEGGAADRAGIQPKDIIIDLGGYEVKSYTALTRALRNYKAGDTTTVTIIRSGGQLVLDITLDEKPQTTAPAATTPAPQENMPSEGNPNEWFEYYRRYFGG